MGSLALAARLEGLKLRKMNPRYEEESLDSQNSWLICILACDILVVIGVWILFKISKQPTINNETKL